MAIFGTGSAQFQEGTGSLVVLTGSMLIPNYIIPDLIEHKSIVTGHKDFISLGDYSEFQVGVNLYKATNPTSTFSTLYSYLHKNVYFWPHIDGKAISGSDGTPVEFNISDMQLSYIENKDYADYLLITFKAAEYTDISKGI